MSASGPSGPLVILILIITGSCKAWVQSSIFLPIFSNANILKIKIIKRQHIIINSGRFLTKKRKNKKIGKK